MRKTTLLLLSILFFGPVNSFAQVDQPDPITPTIFDVVGPVKELRVENVCGREIRKYVRHFDFKGRLISHEEYLNDSLISGFINQYSDSNMYTVSFYKSDRRINKEHNVVYLDTIGQVIKKEHYCAEVLMKIDSIAYDSIGRRIKDFCGFLVDDYSFELFKSYEYDSQNRLTTIRCHAYDRYTSGYADNGDKYTSLNVNKYKITYSSNGNYKVSCKNQDNFNIYERKCKVNSLGQLIEINDKDNKHTNLIEYDQHGNWLKRIQKCDYVLYKLETNTIRTIEYYSPKELDSIYLSAEQQPEFPGGQKAMFKYIADNVVCPLSVQKKGYQGRTYCQFVVNKSGDIFDISIVKSSGQKDLDKEAERVVSSMPKWKPGKINGEPIRMKYTVPVSYKIEPAPAIDSGMEQDTTIYTVVEKMPEFPGGQQALFKFLSENVKYPVSAQERGIQGRVICQFVVNCDGSIVDVMVVRHAEHSLDAEAVRVLSSMPKWIPAVHKGEKVRVKYTVPVNFKLEGATDEYIPDLWREQYYL